MKQKRFTDGKSLKTPLAAGRSHRSDVMRQESKTRRRDLTPQQFEHRCECWITAAVAAATGMVRIMRALAAQQSPEWRRQRGRTRKAMRDFRAAATWLRRSLEKEEEEPGK